MDIMKVNEAELRALGIDPASPMSSPRTRTDRIDVQYGEDRIQRSASGGITHSYGYFTAEQQSFRRRWAEAIVPPAFVAFMEAAGSLESWHREQHKARHEG